MNTLQRSQYFQIKKKYPDHIMLFQTEEGGDWHTIDHGADICAEILSFDKPEQGGELIIPDSIINKAIAQLTSKGYPVAICQKIIDPTNEVEK